MTICTYYNTYHKLCNGKITSPCVIDKQIYSYSASRRQSENIYYLIYKT